MHRVSRSTPPANFHVTAAASDASSVLPDPQLAASTRDPDRPPVTSRGRWQLSRHPTFFDRASVWWDSWMPVATTGWGALILIAPLVVMSDLLARAAGHRSPGRNPG